MVIVKTRAFLALDIASPQVIDRLVAAMDELKAVRADIGLAARQNLHFTIKFLGEIPDTLVTEIDRRIERLDLPSCEVRLEGIGVFPDIRHPRVVWAGVSRGDAERISALASPVIEALEGVGRPEDHEFHAHVTLGRVRSPRNSEALAIFVRRNAAREFGSTKIDSLKLKSSILARGGPTYSDIREYPLK